MYLFLFTCFHLRSIIQAFSYNVCKPIFLSHFRLFGKFYTNSVYKLSLCTSFLSFVIFLFCFQCTFRCTRVRYAFTIRCSNDKLERQRVTHTSNTCRRQISEKNVSVKAHNENATLPERVQHNSFFVPFAQYKIPVSIVDGCFNESNTLLAFKSKYVEC